MVLVYVGPLVVVTTAGRKPAVSSKVGKPFFVKQDEAGSSKAEGLVLAYDGPLVVVTTAEQGWYWRTMVHWWW